LKLSIDKLKELLPDAVLDRRGKNLLAKCPQCNADEFGISIEENHLFGCYRMKKCGFTGNIFTLAKFLKRTDILSLEGGFTGKVEKLENKILKKEIPLDLTLPTAKMPMGWIRSKKDEYLDSRGFTEYERYKVGRTLIDPRYKKNYIITAIEDEGEIKGYIGRHIWSKKRIDEENELRKEQGIHPILRYRNSDTDFSKLLFGYDEIITNETKTIIAVEGIFDKWNIDKILKLHNQKEVKCNATFKCAITKEQILKWQLKGIETIILFYDPDVLRQINKTAFELEIYFNVFIAFNEIGDKDAGDMNEKDIVPVVNNLKKPTDFFINKIFI
jgi:DNA primase